VREALFSILGTRILGARLLDLYAGTGAIGIEAFSRGAHRVTFVESNPRSLRVLRGNLQRCGLTPLADIHTCRVDSFLERAGLGGGSYDIVFADPPYHTDEGEKLLPSLASSAIITCDSLVILEHFTKMMVPPQVARLLFLRQYRYGDTTLSVFRVHAEAASSP
jgi:16S rRNA (guanine(966)-N(2))-methyltransferase RsmD